MARKSISKKIRFEVFKRDSFKCQYCGSEPPNVILHVDHIHPVSKDGDNDLMNLITSCQSCNLGKGASTLSDKSTILKQKEMLNELNEKREQLEMLLKWREGLKNIDNIALEACINSWNNLVSKYGYEVNEQGIKILSIHLKRHGLKPLLDAIDIVVSQYLIVGDDGKLIDGSIEEAFNKIGPIASVKSKPDHIQKLLYCRGIARKRLSYFDDRYALNLLKNAYDGMISYSEDEYDDHILSEIKDICLTARNWSEFRSFLVNLSR